MKLVINALMFAWLFALTACVQIPQDAPFSKTKLAVTSVWDIPTTFPAGSKYSISPRHIEHISIKAESEQRVYALYKETLIENLSNQGFLFTEQSEDADFYVGYALALAKDLDDKKISNKFGVTPGLQIDKGLEKASFLIYVEDAKTHQRLWRGAVQGIVHHDNSTDERKIRSNKVVATVMQQFYNAK